MGKITYKLLAFVAFVGFVGFPSVAYAITNSDVQSIDQVTTTEAKSWTYTVDEPGNYQLGYAWIWVDGVDQAVDFVLKVGNDTIKTFTAKSAIAPYRFETRLENLTQGEVISVSAIPKGGASYRLSYHLAYATPTFTGLLSYDVANYGAVGDSIANDYQAVQDACNAAKDAGGGIVTFDGSKTYYVKGPENYALFNFINTANIKVEGNGEKLYAPSMVDSEASGNQYSTDMWADEAIDLINTHDQEQPLFMYLSFNAPHHPLDAPKEILDQYSEEDIEAYWSGSEAKKGRKAKSRKYYMAMMDAMDRAIGDVIETVDKNGMKENTLIVFCSDNGGIIEADNRPFRSLKGDSYEGGIRVPGIVYWPGKVKAGSTSEELVYMADWYSTFAELAGMSCESENLDGVSALSVMQGGKSRRQNISIISEQRHALITPDFSLVGNSNNYQRSINNKLKLDL